MRACTVVKLDVADLRRAVDDPALQALLVEGWQVLCSVVIDDGPGGQSLHLVLRPPLRPVVVEAVPRWAVAVLGASVALGPVLAVLAALALR